MSDENKMSVDELERLIEDGGEEIEIKPNGQVVVKDQPAKKARVLELPKGPTHY